MWEASAIRRSAALWGGGDYRAAAAAAGGRGAELRVLGMMMGGRLVWATLPSRAGSHTLTVAFNVPLHDAVQTPTDEAEYRAIANLAHPESLSQALACVDRALWP